MRTERSPSCVCRIWIAGDYDKAIDICREYVLKGLCVSVQRVDYVFTMGMESGVCVTLINYPRFPKMGGEIKDEAIALGHALMEGLHQGSFTVECDTYTYWFSRRKQDEVAE